MLVIISAILTLLRSCYLFTVILNHHHHHHHIVRAYHLSFCRYNVLLSVPVEWEAARHTKTHLPPVGSGGSDNEQQDKEYARITDDDDDGLLQRWPRRYQSGGRISTTDIRISGRQRSIYRHIPAPTIDGYINLTIFAQSNTASLQIPSRKTNPQQFTRN